MDLKLNHILNLSPSEIANSRIELNMTEGSGGIALIDKWLSLPKDERSKGVTDCSYWGWYGNRKNFSVGQTVFSFVKKNAEEWLFISAAEILEVPPHSRAKVQIIDRFAPLFGRLVIKYKKGNTYARYVFKLQALIEDCVVREIIQCMYDGEQFEGYDRVHLPYAKLKDIFEGKIMPTYHEALEKITGVYCLTDRNTGKLYIGSATGEGGVAQRWGNYLNSQHGGNKKLAALYQKEGAEYFEKNFTFTLIEYFGLSYDTEKILKREQYWKECFDTRINGYNDN